MTINDLHPGDWVTFGWHKNLHSDSTTNPYKVKEIKDDVIVTTDRDFFTIYNPKNDCGAWNIVPIMLDPDILTKNGFHRESNYWVFEEDDLCLKLGIIANGYVFLSESPTINISTVHRLQHLMNLCGFHKSIEL